MVVVLVAWFGSVPPQQDWVESQKSPVSRQPAVIWHTGTPLPRSTQLRLQQFELPPQGRPSSVQPEPVGSRQRPGVGLPAPTVQSPVQQSFGPLQMSPVALQPEYAGWQVFPLVPVTQFVEQQSPATEQFSPSVLQPPLVPAGTGAQCAVASQMSEQHCEPSLHSDSVPVPLGRQIDAHVAPGIPAPGQLRLQQSVSFAQAYPSRLHSPPMHWWTKGSQ